MNSKPKSWAALKKSVQAADVKAMPSAKLGAKRADKMILSCIAESGSDVGAGSHPGNAAIEQSCGLRWSQCHEHIVKLVNAGMLERNEAVGGRGLGSVYRIVWNHPVFPDHSANGREWFIEKPSGLEDKNPPDSANETIRPESETLRIEGANHPGSDAKPSGLEAKPSGRRPEHIPIPSQEHPYPSPPSAPNPRVGWEAFVGKAGNIPDAYAGQQIGKLKPRYEKLLLEHGERILSELLWLFWIDRKPPLDGCSRNRYAVFLDEGLTGNAIAKAKENAKRPKSSAQLWWEENTTEGREAFENDAQRKVDEAMSNAQRLAAAKMAECNVDDEESVEETRRWLLTAR
jgi:hypothetical protein